MIWLLLIAAQLPPSVEQGSKLFAKSCATGYCHGAEGAAARGPRLRDRQFDRDYLLKVTRDGIPRSAMPAWKDRFSPEEIDAVVDYIVHLNGGKIESSKPKTATPAANDRAARTAFTAECAGCHQAKGTGLASGVPLDAKAVWPPATKKTLQLTLKDQETFPAWIVSEASGITVALDLTDPAPIRRSLETSEIASRQPVKWSHPPVDWGRFQTWLMLP